MKELGNLALKKSVWFWISLSLPVLLLLTVKPVLAHGEGRTLQRGHILVSACYLTIWTAPAILRTGEVHVEATVFNQDGAPAQTALVQVMLTPLQGETLRLSAPAQTVIGLAPSLYTAAFKVQQAGRYRVTVQLTDADGSGVVEFDVEIRDVPRWIVLVIYSQLVTTLLVGIWLAQKGFTVWFGKAPSAMATTA